MMMTINYFLSVFFILFYQSSLFFSFVYGLSGFDLKVINENQVHVLGGTSRTEQKWNIFTNYTYDANTSKIVSSGLRKEPASNSPFFHCFSDTIQYRCFYVNNEGTLTAYNSITNTPIELVDPTRDRQKIKIAPEQLDVAFDPRGDVDYIINHQNGAIFKKEYIETVAQDVVNVFINATATLPKTKGCFNRDDSFLMLIGPEEDETKGMSLWKANFGTMATWRKFPLNDIFPKEPVSEFSCSVTGSILYFYGVPRWSIGEKQVYKIRLNDNTVNKLQISKKLSENLNSISNPVIGALEKYVFFGGVNSSNIDNFEIIRSAESNEQVNILGEENKKENSNNLPVILGTVIPILTIVSLAVIGFVLHKKKKEKGKMSSKERSAEMQRLSRKSESYQRELDQRRGRPSVGNASLSESFSAADKKETVVEPLQQIVVVLPEYPKLIITTTAKAGSSLTDEVSEQQAIDDFISAIDHQFYVTSEIKRDVIKGTVVPGTIFNNLFNNNKTLPKVHDTDLFALNHVICTKVKDYVYDKWNTEFLEEAIHHLRNADFLPQTHTVTDAQVYRALYKMLETKSKDSGDNYAYLNIVAPVKNQILMRISQLCPSLVIENKLVDLNEQLADLTQRLVLASLQAKSVDPMCRFLLVSSGEVFDQTKMKIVDTFSIGRPTTEEDRHSTIVGATSIGLINKMGTVRVKCHVLI